LATHHFQPTRYYNTIGSHEPALCVADGDTIITTTVDARGGDEHGEQITPRGNPMSGPFYVEGTEPGDTLAVTIERLTPNRGTGWSGTIVAPAILEPNFVRGLPEYDILQWNIDQKAGTVSLVDPPEALKGLTLPIEPMIGCFGVAPVNGQAIGTGTSGEYGGNMDYRGFKPGVTVYFPVFVPGALFHLGDGHACQGDGEIAGTGIETSFEMEVTLRVQKGRHITWPRGEDDGAIFTVGNARPLDQAVQHATTEMMRWLDDEYGLDATAASILLGQAVRYDTGNVFDPAYTMVCRLSKDILRSLAGSHA
jgi:acetamidase/formamidase